MKIARTMAMTGVLAIGALLGANAMATNTAHNSAHAKCTQQAKDKKLTGSAAKSFVKKCQADAAAATK